MSRPLVFWLPKPPDNANGRMHYMQANRLKKAYWEELRLRRAYGQIPPEPPTPFARATVLVEWHYPNGRNHLDPDNAIRRLKHTMDWLVANAYLAGDTGEHVTWLPVATIVGAPTPALCTVRLTLTPCT